MKNRRKSERSRVSLKGTMYAHGKKARVDVRNLSMGGALVMLDSPVMDGVEIEIHIDLQGREIGPDEKFSAQGTVVWCTEDLDVGFQVGVRFDAIENPASEVLKSFLE